MEVSKWVGEEDRIFLEWAGLLGLQFRESGVFR
jgi:hypothetical protein